MRSKRESSKSFMLLGVAFVGITGCAHRPVTPPSEAPVSRAATTPASVESARVVVPQGSAPDDLAALLEQCIIHFDFDAKRLNSESLVRLDRLAQALRAHPEAKIQVTGNCDDRGTEEYNFALGQERAAAAKRYLVDLGIASSRIEVVSGGEERPVDRREAEDAWAANRRDEFSLLAGH
ncbi:MAG: OmpA family protein [Myxococcaceae bacterium]|nr:OmpA family protein [Myxococcaceae bacterium]